MTKKIVYVDQDGVLADYYGAFKKAIAENPEQPYPQSKWGFFLTLKPLENAIASYKLLEQHFDVRVLTRPSFKNVHCYTEKAQWIWDNLGYDALEKAILSGDKSLLKGHYLIDDQRNAKQEHFEGEWIHFASDKFPDWTTTTAYILQKEGFLK